MKILLDENLPHRLRLRLHGHEVATVSFMGWKGVENGDLLKLAAANGFDVLLTKDSGMEHQLNPTSLPISVVVLMAASNAFEDMEPLIPALLARLACLEPRTLVRIPER
ncbi:MAG: DUF5615 family PIN-like protein [Phycisphaerae bacterium]|nr:DUF5615 family PIN-like protein [Phycisphaerae bacterium]